MTFITGLSYLLVTYLFTVHGVYREMGSWILFTWIFGGIPLVTKQLYLEYNHNSNQMSLSTFNQKYQAHIVWLFFIRYSIPLILQAPNHTANYLHLSCNITFLFNEPEWMAKLYRNSVTSGLFSFPPECMSWDSVEFLSLYIFSQNNFHLRLSS